MDIKDKIIKALLQPPLKATYIRLEDDDGISGYVVSPKFKGMSSLDRQGLIERAMRTAPNPLTQQEQRQVLMIAGLTPAEYEEVGPRIRVHRIKEMAAGKVEVLLHGGMSDAEYIRGTLNNQKGVQTTEPKQVPGALGILMSFQAKGTEADPLTKAKTVRVLKNDPYIEVMANA